MRDKSRGYIGIITQGARGGGGLEPITTTVVKAWVSSNTTYFRYILVTAYIHLAGLVMAYTSGENFELGITCALMLN
jgi:hypothetical protein